MPNDIKAQTDQLLTRALAISASEENQRRRRCLPERKSSLSVENCTGWARIFRFDAGKYYRDPEFFFLQNLKNKLWRWDNLPDDDVPMEPDIGSELGYYMEYTFFGLNLEYSAEGVPVIQDDHPLTRDPDMKLLKPVDYETSGWMPRAMRWYEEISRVAAGRVKVGPGISWGRGCLDLAMQLRGYENLMVDAVERPAFVHDLLKWLVEQRCRWHEAYYRHWGGKPAPAGIADDWINIPYITPEFFAEFVLPRYLEIEAFHGGVVNIHSCGNTLQVQPYFLKLKSLPVIEVSAWTDLEGTVRQVPSEKQLVIALHPNDVLVASDAEMEAKIKSIQDTCRGRSYKVLTGGLTPLSHDNAAFIGRLRAWQKIANRLLNPV